MICSKIWSITNNLVDFFGMKIYVWSSIYKYISIIYTVILVLVLVYISPYETFTKGEYNKTS